MVWIFYIFSYICGVYTFMNQYFVAKSRANRYKNIHFIYL